LGGRAKNSRKQTRVRALSPLRLLWLLIVYGAFACAGASVFAYSEFARELPDDLTAAVDYRPTRASRVYSADGELIGEFFLQKRVVVPAERIPAHLEQAFVSAEDQRFWDHPGFDTVGIVRAAWANFRGGQVSQGASTITQQATRMLLLNRAKTISRKIKELILSVRIERELTKREILHLYLNQVYLGHGAYGVAAASEVYFGKTVEQLTVAEAAMLAGLPQAPSKYSPHLNYDLARQRQLYVLGRMSDDGFLSPQEAESAYRQPVALVAREQPINDFAAPYFVDHVRRWATERYGHRSVFFGGLRIYTTLDSRKQLLAEAAVREGLQALDRRIGFRGPLGHLSGGDMVAFMEGPPRPYIRDGREAVSGRGEILDAVPYLGVVTRIDPAGRKVWVDAGPRLLAMDRDSALSLVRWTGERGEKLAAGDVIPVELAQGRRGETVFALSQRPDVQAAMVALDPSSGRVEALVGGYDFRQSKFNRATMARRQAGSAIKPFIYATALQNGFHQLSIVNDAPVKVRTASGVWSPGNFKPEYLGPITLRTALANSINTVSVRLVLTVGVDAVIRTMRTMGIASDFVPHVSIALGTPDVTLLELVSAYASFPAAGLRVEPRFVDLVTSDDGVVLEDLRADRPRERAISAELAFLMADLMSGVVDRGTGRWAQALERPTAGKTGTSTGHRDAWFLGYTTDRIAGVWVGRDDFTPIGAKATGGSAALPIWLQYMAGAHPDTPPRPFEPPSDIVFVRASELTGEPLAPGAAGARWVPFARGSVPEKFTDAVEAARFRPSADF